MKHNIRELLNQSIASLVESGTITGDAVPETIPVENTRRRGHGDYATGIALGLARAIGCKPQELAAMIRDRLPDSEIVDKAEIAGPGFINFFLSERAFTVGIKEIIERGEKYGTVERNDAQRILIEYVSANPTGPLHVGHGRGAAFGDALARLLRAAGHMVETEYYVNNLGRQMDILALSVWVRYLQLTGTDVEVPKGAYQGQYVVHCAQGLMNAGASGLNGEFPNFTEKRFDDDEAALTESIRFLKLVIGEEKFEHVRQYALAEMVHTIRNDLAAFGVEFDRWFYESEVMEAGEIDHSIQLLYQRGHVYDSDGATWFRSSDFGDEKDRVVVRSNGELTYFASDIAYHLNKFKRGYNSVVNIWGADHHGYISRMMAALEGAGENSKRLKILLVQFASLYRGKVKVPMSTRMGEFVPLRELINETGKDAARFFYVLRKSEQHLDFDLELAKSQSSENPVYYVQYAHARICSVFRQMHERGLNRESVRDHTFLVQESELDLMKRVLQYPEVVESAAHAFEPHQVAYYLRDVANDFHSFYNKERILDCEQLLRDARLDLIDAVRQVLANGLNLLGVSAPESM